MTFERQPTTLSNTIIRLLLVEDDEDDYIITKSLLDDIDSQQYMLDWVNNVDDARLELARNDHDVCLMDYSLGAEDGVALLKEAIPLGFTGPVIMLTGQDDDRLDAEALSAGAVDYLVKMQLNASRLARAIRYAVSRREMERERVERLRAESQNRAKSVFLTHLSHELRTPLTAILGYADLLISQTTDQEHSSFLQVIKRNGSHLLSLLNDVLDLSKIEAGKLEIEHRRFAVMPFITDIVALMRVAAKDKNISFNCHASTTIPTYLYSDDTRLRQILLNLIGNAIKFTDEGGVDILIHLDQDCTPAQLKFHIMDSGIGIPAEEIPRLFTPFTQASNNQQHSDKGTGLGLAISNQLAQRLNGEIDVHSEQSQGSRFTLSLNCSRDDLAECAPLDLTASKNPTPATQLKVIHSRILVADDISEIRHLVGQFIRQAGADVLFASNGREALSQIEAAAASGNPVKLALLDMQMPELSGFDVARTLRERGLTLPLIALTASTMRGQREKCLEAGCDDHLSKPIDQGQLIETIRHHLDKHAAMSDLNRKQRILLIEDENDARDITHLLLDNAGYDVIDAQTGLEALRLAEATKPDVILLDLNLPDMNGLDLSGKIRAAGLENTFIVLLSGAEVDKTQLSAAGIDAYHRKPIELDKLLALFPPLKTS